MIEKSLSLAPTTKICRTALKFQKLYPFNLQVTHKNSFLYLNSKQLMEGTNSKWESGATKLPLVTSQMGHEKDVSLCESRL